MDGAYDGVVKATLVRGTKERGLCAVRDLSRTGARLVGSLDVFEREPVLLVIELAEALSLTAEVMRVDRQRKVVEVEFRGVTAEALARIDESIAVMLKSTSSSTVLVVHPIVQTSSALERDLARVRVGARVLPALEGVAAALADGDFIGIVVSGSFGEAVGPVLELCETTYSQLRRVLLFDDQIAKLEHSAARRVDAVLRTPWRFKGLARALDLRSEDVVTTYDQLVALQMPIGSKKQP